MTRYGPLVLAPRLDTKPWGGRRLAEFGFQLPDGTPIGEALITDAAAQVINGLQAGRTLGDIVASDAALTCGPAGLAATGGRPIFPLLIKIIDAEDVLSIQIHPDDASAPGDSLGKTEVWHVISTRPGALMYAGLRPEATAEELSELARAGRSTAGLIRALPAQEGMTLFLPAGTIHALGAGTMIYEVQQPSAITYRFDDWGRVDAQGQGRDLHIEEGLAVLDPSSRPDPRRLGENAPRELLAECRYFALERLTAESGETFRFDAPGSPQVFTLLDGVADLTAADTTVRLDAGKTAVVLAAEGPAELRIEAPTVVLRSWVPTS